MKIGILTFYRVANFGANLQAVSTYFYLKKRGYIPIFIFYESEETRYFLQKKKIYDIQKMEHFNFIDNVLSLQTKVCRTTKDINNAIKEYQIDAIIIGSDAVLQHHPFITRIKAGRRKPFYILPSVPERMYPNPFWGNGINPKVPTVMMSVSSQNSEYKWFSSNTKNRMAQDLNRMKYISVRDFWTQKMLKVINPLNPLAPITPDPVFSFNKNVSELIPSEADLHIRYKLPQKYVLVCLHDQHLTLNMLKQLKEKFIEKGMECVAFPMPTGINFRHPFNFSVDTPLSPLDWYGLIKYSSAYIGSNMHPIVVCLHNSVPCFSIDAWGSTNFFGKHINNNSSKVQHILEMFGLYGYRATIDKGQCNITSDIIIDKIISFPKQQVRKKASYMQNLYNNMMDNILHSLRIDN